MHNKRRFAWLLIFIAILLPMPALVKYLQTLVVRNAIVTAYLYEIRAPISGEVIAVDVTPGAIPGAFPAVILSNTRISHLAVDRIAASRIARQQILSFQKKELSVIQKEISACQKRLSAYRDILQKDLNASIRRIEVRSGGEETRLWELGQKRQRAKGLTGSSAFSLADLDRIEADFREAEAFY